MQRSKTRPGPAPQPRPSAAAPRRPRTGARLPWAGLLVAALLLAALPAHGQFWFSDRPMPEFDNQAPQAWINSEPLQRADLAGKVVLIEIWTSV